MTLIIPIEMSEISSLRQEQGMSLQEAKASLVSKRLEKALLTAENFEELKQAMIFAFDNGLFR